MIFLEALPRATALPPAEAHLKHSPEDFFVEEVLDLEFSGIGEHVYLFVEKTGQNTEFVAKQLARALGVRAMDVGFSGLKDRWAVTRQWFSVYVRNRDVSSEDIPVIEGVNLLDLKRHNRKLRRGEHSANRFSITLRNLQDDVATDQILNEVKERGFPNYFGSQRFGHQNQNLDRARKWFAGEIKASRSQRAFYLSAVRSYLYNLLLSQALESKAWLSADGPLYGDDVEGVQSLSEDERRFFESYPELVAGLHKNRTTLARRPYRSFAEGLTWSRGEGSLTLNFSLPPGSFATVMLREAFNIHDVSQVQVWERSKSNGS